MPRPHRNYWREKAQGVSERRRNVTQLYDRRAMQRISVLQRRWTRSTVDGWVGKAPERKEKFENPSGIPLKRLYTPLDASGQIFDIDLSFPGQFPFTRGIYPTMYRGRSWTMRMFSGYGTPEETNSRLKYLLKEGETGLSIAFDMPTLYGVDADSPRAEGEVGKCGVSVSSLKDMEVIFDGIPLDMVSTSMTINAPASVVTCMYLATAQKRGLSPSKLRGTVRRSVF